ncbi:MAG: hypothetical protein IEMM0002_0711 [bacterium]|nr:MAG: hypothetical protein IEMM0002_0711 [bacterium]
MIYVTVGNHDQPFDRLILAMDEIAQKLEAPIIMQTGVSVCDVRHSKAQDFFSYGEAEEFIKTADVVVAHAGIGTVISARKWGTPLIICPRRKMLGEHFNDHQFEISRELVKNPRPGVEVALETEEIEHKITLFLKPGREKIPLRSQDHAQSLKNCLLDFLDNPDAPGNPTDP